MKKFAAREIILWLVILAGAGVFLYTTFGADPMVGSAAPPLALKNVDGEVVDIANDRGKVVVLNIYATWCGPCKHEIPDFASFHEEVERAGLPVKLYGVVYESGPPAVAVGTSRKLGINYPILLGSGPVAERYRLRQYPTTIIIDADGHVHNRVEGVMTRKMLAQAVAKAQQAH